MVDLPVALWYKGCDELILVVRRRCDYDQINAVLVPAGFAINSKQQRKGVPYL